jgi:O-antigen ligase
MTLLTRAGWLLSAAVFGTLAASILHVHFAGPVPLALLAAVAVLSAVRPEWALAAVAALTPIAWFGATRWWNPAVPWADALVCAALAGFAIDACRGRTAVPRALAVPAAVLGAIVAASMGASLRVLALREGPAVSHHVWETITRTYFIDESLRWLHAGLLLLEGTLLFAHAARLGTRPGVLQRVCAATAIGSAAAAICTFDRLAEAAARAPSFWPALFDLAGRLRWNVHYTDMNAAGSFYALALLAGAAIAATSGGARRLVSIVCIVCTAAALWLTSSRIAILAVPAAAAAALILPLVIRGRRQAVIAATACVAACAVLVFVAVSLPERGLQRSPLLAADVRVGLIQTGVRMMRAAPAFGIGLGEFHRRAVEFSSSDLLEKFPAVLQGENAHNNVVQIAAETGIAGGLAFTWTIGAALLAAAWRATATRDRFMQLVFAALAAFAFTMLAGHPLLVPEAAFGFWLLAGAAGGAAIGDRSAAPRSARFTILATAALLLVVVTAPLRVGAAGRDANLEHVGIDVSGWRLSPDGIRYREATGAATLFVPPGAFKFSVSLRGTTATPLEISIEGRTANVRVLVPGTWTDIVVPARNVASDNRFRRMELRTIDDRHTVFWITKDEPVGPQ